MPPRPELGRRHTCHRCGTKYYDFNAGNAHCPQCATRASENPKQDPRKAAMARLGKSSGSPRPSAPKNPEPVEDADSREETEEEFPFDEGSVEEDF